MTSTPRIAIQGGTGSYHDLAQQTYFSEPHTLITKTNFKEVFACLLNGEADRAMVAIENSLYGSINEVYNLLLKYKPWICGEVYLRIDHHLLGFLGSNLSDIKSVYTQREAMAQCEEFLDNRLAVATRFETADTAGAAEMVAQSNDHSKAAIASIQAGALYGLVSLQAGIETNKQNYTRFIVLEQQKPVDNGASTNKTSIILELGERPGVLHEALGAFASRNVNLSKIESRPIIGKAWHYLFYLDYEAGINSNLSQAILQELIQQGGTITVLGSYSKGRVVT